MFEKNMRLAYLLDFYGDVLDEHSRSVMYSYYEDDLSLSEIATGIGISRQGVRHIIKKSEEQLDFLEQKLGLADKFMSIEEAASDLDGIARELLLCESGSVRALGERVKLATVKIRSKNN